MTVAVSCDGAVHRVSLVGGELLLEDHDAEQRAQELALGVLGATVPPCVLVWRAWHDGDLDGLDTELADRALPALLPALRGKPLTARTRLVLEDVAALAWRDLLARSAAWATGLSVVPISFAATLMDAVAGPRRNVRQIAHQANVTGMATPSWVDVKAHLTLSWFEEVWLPGLAVLDGDVVIDVVRNSPAAAHVHVARWSDRPGVVDSQGNPMPTSTGRVWRLATVPRQAVLEPHGWTAIG